MHQQTDDSLLIRRVLQGQQNAYAMLVDKYSVFVFTLVMRYVQDWHLSEELSQDVFVKAYRYLADFKGNSKFSTWLYTIAHRTCLSHSRKRKADFVYPDADKMAALSVQQGKYERADGKLEQHEQQQLLAQAIELLPPEDAQVIMFFYHGGQSVEEIGQIMALTATNVKTRLFRSRQRLRAILEQNYTPTQLQQLKQLLYE